MEAQELLLELLVQPPVVDFLDFTGIGTGTYHSFTTVKENVVNAEVTKNLVTVSTSSTHGLSLRDSVEVAVNPTTTTTITVKYNDHNRRIVFNPKTFVAGDVDVSENTITLSNHGFNSGDKVIHTATTSSGGLVNESIYYIFRYSKDKVKLCNTEYEALKFNPKVVDITESSAGTLSEINPSVNGYRGGILKFDLSDSSLSSISNSTLYSALSLIFTLMVILKTNLNLVQKPNLLKFLKLGILELAQMHR